jgi:hypothetical protein
MSCFGTLLPYVEAPGVGPEELPKDLASSAEDEARSEAEDHQEIDRMPEALAAMLSEIAESSVMEITHRAEPSTQGSE